MRPPFRLNKTIGEAYDMDLADTLITKQTLASLGHLETPDGGFDPYPDRPMIEAVKSFQRAEGLTEDGVMKPDGPTLARLNSALENASVPAFPSNRQDTSTTSLLGPAPDPTSPLDRHLTSLSARPGAEASVRPRRPAPEGVQVTMAPAVTLIPPLIGLAARTLLGQTARTATGAATAGAAGALMGRVSKEGQNQTAPERTDIAPAFPPPPRYEPPDTPLPDRTESPSKPIELSDLSQPIPETSKSTIFILPVPDEDLQTSGMIVEDRRGNFQTKAEIERIQTWIEKTHPDWTHEGGGADRKKGGLSPEYWIPSVTKTFGGDGRSGGTFVDLSFKTPSGKWVHFQTVDVDPKTGKVTQKELDAADRIRRSGKNVNVILIPKGVQMGKYNKRSKGN
ncbi:peptidoglycan-binding protein [bacterium SCSIO 12827]|nr:peptidoglycan-binding protein [bacterium SCSIO 12827]